MKYKASLGPSQKTRTTLFCIAVLGLNLLPVYFHFKSYEVESYFLLGILIPDIILLFLFLTAPRSYTVYERGILINSLLKSVKIPLADIDKVELLRKGDLESSIRSFGVGGFFGHFGKFHSKKYGEMTWYLTNKNHLVLLHTRDGKRVLLSPDNSTMFDEIMAFLKGYT